ncbi:MAG TPA: hypothetical protein VM490_22760, partial [Armatimonadaceae bacterium]|nr:hypothetical protein [Armatimonadaceae bacterium]
FPPPPPPRPLADDFEDQTPGERPSGSSLVVNEDADAGRGNVRVTTETAASGRQSVKVTDAPGQKAAYNPHLYYRAKLSGGTVVGRFALRWEAGTTLSHEWRDAASPYAAGPSLSVDRDGGLRANGRETLRLPPGQWVRVEITCPLGDRAKGAYDLAIRLPDGETRAFRGVPCGDAFRELRWFGFVAEGHNAGMFYLDDVAVTPLP